MIAIGSNNIFTNYIKTLVNDKYKVRSGFAYYDSKTHYYLGRFLKEYKANTGIDLLSMYNAYSENIITGYNLMRNGEIKGFSGDSAYDLISIQVEPKDQLSLVFQTDFPITVATGFYNGRAFLQTKCDNAKIFYRSSLKEAHLYEVPNYEVEHKDAQYLVDNLVVLIKVPKSCTKRLIQFGDRRSNTEVVFGSIEEENKAHNIDNMTHLNVNAFANVSDFFVDGKSISILDELIAYLIEYNITELDEIYDNRVDIQKLVSSHALRKNKGVRYTKSYVSGNLDFNILAYLKQVRGKFISSYNNIGRVDKELESFLRKEGEIDA